MPGAGAMGLGGMAAPAGGALAGGAGGGLGMPGLQGAGLDTQEKGFVKLSTDPESLHQAFHYADIAAPRLHSFSQLIAVTVYNYTILYHVNPYLSKASEAPD